MDISEAVAIYFKMLELILQEPKFVRLPSKPIKINFLPEKGEGFVIVLKNRAKYLFRYDEEGNPNYLGRVLREGKYRENHGLTSLCKVV